jgi:hypothetical protein
MIITFLLNEKANARDITDRLYAQFGEHIYKPRTIQLWITEVLLGRQDVHDTIRNGRSPLDDLDAKILVILDKSLFEFESARSIAETLHAAHSIVLLHLHDSLEFRSFHLHWMPHSLTHDLHEKQIKYGYVVLPVLHAAERDEWHHLVTGDKL